MVSALEHWSYCPRQCGLIHLEQTYDENIFTLRGSRVHSRVDKPTKRSEEGAIIERGLPIWSDTYGLIGKADVVEFHSDKPYPVEYKSGAKRRGQHEALQLCAQALCLEEMFQVSIPHGAIYWVASRSRVEIAIDERLRAKTVEVIEEVREMWRQSQLPDPANDARCPNCSLLDACLPHAIVQAKLTSNLFRAQVEKDLP